MRGRGWTSTSGPAASPARNRHQPQAAIMAPLSVQRAGGGVRTRTCGRSTRGARAHEDALPRGLVAGGGYRLSDQGVHDRLLEGGGKLWRRRRRPFFPPHEAEHLRLEAAEREVVRAGEAGG